MPRSQRPPGFQWAQKHASRPGRHSPAATSAPPPGPGLRHFPLTGSRLFDRWWIPGRGRKSESSLECVRPTKSRSAQGAMGTGQQAEAGWKGLCGPTPGSSWWKTRSHGTGHGTEWTRSLPAGGMAGTSVAVPALQLPHQVGTQALRSQVGVAEMQCGFVTSGSRACKGSYGCDGMF